MPLYCVQCCGRLCCWYGKGLCNSLLPKINMAPIAGISQSDLPPRDSARRSTTGHHATPQTGLRTSRHLAPLRVSSLPGGSDHSLADTIKQIQATRDALRAELPSHKNTSAGGAASVDVQRGPLSVQAPAPLLRRCVSDGMCFVVAVTIHT